MADPKRICKHCGHYTKDGTCTKAPLANGGYAETPEDSSCSRWKKGASEYGR